jgi:hypothetical protein
MELIEEEEEDLFNRLSLVSAAVTRRGYIYTYIYKGGRRSGAEPREDKKSRRECH